MKKYPMLKIYKTNEEGTGCAVGFEVRAAFEDRKGYVRIVIIPQSEDDWRRLDWDGRVEANLSVADVFALLPVLNGETGSARVSTRSDSGDRYRTEARRGRGGECYVRICFSSGDGPDDYSSTSREARLEPHEAAGVAKAIESALGRLAFGCA